MGHPTQIGHHRIEGVIGEGGMGVVYRAFDETLQRPVAIKVLPEARVDDADARARMLREARAASALRHPGIVTVHEIGEADGRTFIVMELVEGETFAELLTRRGALPPAEAVGLVAGVADAIEAAHRDGILHRDIKAANLMVEDGGRVRVLDFGLSKRFAAGITPTPTPSRRTPVAGVRVTEIDPVGATLPPEAELVALPSRPPAPLTPAPVTPAPLTPAPITQSPDPVTMHGARMGTPGYAAPELLDGEEADARSDVFSLGVVLYELVTGKRPFGGGKFDQLRERMDAGRYTPPSQATGGAVGPRFDEVIGRALRADRTQRQASVAALIEEARAALDDSGRGRPSMVPVLAVVAVAVLFALGAFAIGTFGRGGPSDPEEAPPSPVDVPGPLADLAARRQLTDLKGCAYSPAFVGDHTVAFDLTDDNGVDLWKVDLGGGAPVQLTREPTWEWRPAPGRRPGEIVYIVSDMSPEQRPLARIAFLDLATGRETGSHHVVAGSAAVVDGSVYYTDQPLAALRRIDAASDTVALAAPPDTPLYVLSPAVGTHIGMLSAQPDTDARICAIELAGAGGPQLQCLPGRQPLVGRPGLGPDGNSIYYGSVAGIARQPFRGGPEELVAGVLAHGGVAVSPDGSRLVYSDCYAHGPIVNLSVKPPRTLVEEGNLGDPAWGPGGALAWVHHDRGETVLMVSRGGVAREVTLGRLGRVSSPVFDARGERLAFVVRDRAQGLYVTDSDGTDQVTSDPSDGHPVFTADDRLAFTRTDAQGLPRVYTVPLTGGEAKPAVPGTRITLGIDRATGELLLASADMARLVWWNPRTGRERPGPVAPEKPAVEWRLSPSAKWLLLTSGRIGQRLWRLSLERPARPAELMFDPVGAETSNGAAIDDEGRVTVALSKWSGELWEVPAGHGKRY